MRFFLSLIIVIVSFSSCKINKSSITESNEDVTKMSETNEIVIPSDKEPSQLDNIAVAYTSTSRGVFEYTYVSKKETILTEDRTFKDTRTYPTKYEDWKTLLEFIEGIDEEEFRKLQAPTSKRHYDGAPHATLSIIKGDEELMTPSFDHGYPPKPIVDFVAKMLSIRDSHVKQ